MNPRPTSWPSRPAVAAPQPWPFPRPHRHRLSNGIELVLHHLPGQHVISTTVVLDHSLSAEPEPYEGITALAARTLVDGTTDHPGVRFAELLENSGAALGHDTGRSGVQVMMDVPSTHLAPALGLLAEAVRSPDLADVDLRRNIQLRLAEIAQREANSAATATHEFRSRVVAAGDRAGRSVGGNAEQVAALTPDLVRDWTAGWLAPARARIVVGGDLGADTDPGLARIHDLVETCFGDWTGPAGPVTHPTPSGGPASCTVVDRPGAVQADLRLGGWAVDRFDPRWPALRVAGYAMGGAFNSRLNTVLREEKGYTYGARLAWSPLRSGGWYAVQGSFRTEVVGDAVDLARQLLDIRTAGLTAAEVADAQRYLTGATPLQFATADAVVDQAALQLVMGLPDDYLDTGLAQVLEVTADAASEAFGSVVAVDDAVLLVVGDAAALVPQLERVGLAPEVVTGQR